MCQNEEKRPRFRAEIGRNRPEFPLSHTERRRPHRPRK